MKIRPTRRGLRLASGLVLFAYVTAHFVNHALGLVSLATAEAGLRFAVAFWQSPPATVLLYGAAAIHIGLAFSALYAHRTLRLPALEWLRIAAGLSIPTLLIGHAVETRLALEIYGRPTDYAHVVWMLWNSGREGRQIALLVPGWLHGCLGLGFVFVGRSWYPRWRQALFGAALLLPVLAVLGFFAMLKEVTLLAQDPAWVATAIRPVSETLRPALRLVRDAGLALYYGAIGAVFVARLVRRFGEERGARLISIAYPERTIRVPRGWSVLEASRAHRMAHVSICGGRGRCSTCRVAVVGGQTACPPAAEAERRTLQRIGAPPDTRLACQLRPRGDVEIVPLVSAAPTTERAPGLGMLEREWAVMRVDVRWGETARMRLPHDRLHALDRLSRVVAETARAAAGLPLQFTEDRVLVLFGRGATSLEASRRALQGAARLDSGLAELCRQLHEELGVDIEHAIHLHFGVAVVAEIGDTAARALTALGPAIDVVDQMAALAPALPGRAGGRPRTLIVSRAVLAAAGRDPQGLAWRVLALRNGARLDCAALVAD